MKRDREDDVRGEIEEQKDGRERTAAPQDRNALVPSRRAAAMLGIRPQTLRHWRYAGKGPRYIRLGENAYCPCGYRVTDIEAWLSSHSFRHTSEESAGR